MGWQDVRLRRTYRVNWLNGTPDLIEAQGLNYTDCGHIQFWRNNTMVLSVLAAQVSTVVLVSPKDVCG
jgi:hypothetical protein